MLKLISTLLTICFISFCKFSFSMNKKDLAIYKVQTYLQKLKSFEAKFIQISSQGEVKKGNIFLQFPGKLRINYTKPNDLLITSNGFWLVVQNLKLKQTNNIPLNQSPLNKFLNKTLVLNNNNQNISFSKANGIISLTFSDKENLKENSFRLEFTANPVKLKKWIIKDEFENKTTVLLQDLKVGRKYSHELFFPEDFGELN